MSRALNSAAAAAPAPRVAWWRTLSWQMYDFADTVYSMNVYTFYFSLFLAYAFKLDWAAFGWTVTLANLLVAVASPLMGAMSDASQRRLPFLRFFAIGTALSTAFIGFTGSPTLAIILFVISYICYSAAGNFYQALLPGLCNESNVSLVSGIGVALGYVGSIFGLVMMMMLIGGEAQYYLVFPYSAAIFMLFAIPALTMVPDFAPATQRVKLDFASAYRRVADTFRHSRNYPGLFRFLVADFIYENAVNAVIAFMTVYAKAVVGFTDDAVQTFFIFSTVFAVIFGFIFGPIVDRIGPKRSVLITLGIWLLVLPGVALSQTTSQFTYLGPVVGMGLAATWISSRTYLIALAPVQKSGEFFGLYSLSGKSAGVLGVFVWTALLSLLQGSIGEVGALRADVWAMWVFIVIGFVMVTTLPNVRPTKANVLDRAKG